MMTIVALFTLTAGSEAEWDEVMRERFEGARQQPGWVSAQLTTPVERPDQRLIVGTWESREHWQSWHDDPRFLETRTRLEGLQEGSGEVRWHEVVAAAAAA